MNNSALIEENHRLMSERDHERELKHELAKKYAAVKQYSNTLMQELLEKTKGRDERAAIRIRHQDIFEPAAGNPFTGWQ